MGKPGRSLTLVLYLQADGDGRLLETQSQREGEALPS